MQIIREYSQKRKEFKNNNSVWIPMFIDLHCHFDLLKEPELRLKNAEDAGVTTIVASGICPKSNREVLNLSERFGIKATIGLYPYDAMETETGKAQETDTEKEIEFIRKNSDRIIGIGEVGLDYMTGKKGEHQTELFRKMICLAKDLDLPLIIHSRKAEADAIDILESEDCKKVVMHCFSGKKKLLERGIRNRWHFTIPTAVVRSRQYQEMAAAVPLTQLFCETDSPFMSPFKDKVNEPAFVTESYKKIAEIKGIETEECMRAVYLNYQRLFL